MASLKNKIAQNRLKKSAKKKEKNFGNLKAEMKRLMELEEYVEAMDVMAEMAKNKVMDAEVMCMGALCYFYTGDYERSAKWVNDSLSYDNTNLTAKILLAALCFAKNRYEDGMKLTQNILENGVTLSQEEDAFLNKVLEPVKQGYDAMLENYPAVRDYIAEKKKAAPWGVDNVLHRSEGDSQPDARSALAKLKNLLAKNKKKLADEEAGAAQPAVTPPPVSQVAAAQPSEEQPVVPQAAESELAKEQEAVPEIKQETAEPETAVQEAAVPEVAQREEPAQEPAKQEEAKQMQPWNPPELDGTIETAAEILAKKVSQREKLRLLNASAAKYYQRDNDDLALAALDEALKLDEYDDDTLRSKAYVLLTQGDVEGAGKLAARLSVSDFALLYAIKKG